MNAGDHLETPRIGYTHHGLYLGDEQVIHYSGFGDGWGGGPIEIVSLESFSGGARVRVIRHPSRRHSRDESVSRAMSRLGENNYWLLFNNCEHFVNWCIDGDSKSEQVRRAVAVGAGAHVASTVLSGAAKQALVREGVLRAASTVAGYGASWTLPTVATIAPGTLGLVATTTAGAISAPAVAVGLAAAATAYGVFKAVEWLCD